MSKRTTIRRFLALVSAIITIICLVVTIRIVLNVSLNVGIPDLPYNEITSKSIDTQLDLSRTLFQAALLAFGALCGLVIAKKDEVKLAFTSLPDMTMFLGSCVLLLLSIATYIFYLDSISNYLADAGASSARLPEGIKPSIPDIFDQNVNYLFRCQVTSVLAGIINGAMTLISTHHLKGE